MINNVEYIGNHKEVDMNKTLTPHELYLFKQIDVLRENNSVLKENNSVLKENNSTLMAERDHYKNIVMHRKKSWFDRVWG